MVDLPISSWQSRVDSPQAFPDGVMFDWDETLFQYQYYEPVLWQKLIDNCASEPRPSIQQAEDLWYKGHELCCETYFPNYTPDSLIKKWNDYQKDIPQQEVKLIPGARELLELLKRNNVPLMVVSNKDEDVLKDQIKRCNVADYFDVVVGADKDWTKRKPNANPILKAFNEINNKRIEEGKPRIIPNNLWFVGDHPDDAKAAWYNMRIQTFIVGEKYHEEIRNIHGENANITYLQSLQDFYALVANIPSTAQLR